MNSFQLKKGSLSSCMYPTIYKRQKYILNYNDGPFFILFKYVRKIHSASANTVPASNPQKPTQKSAISINNSPHPFSCGANPKYMGVSCQLHTTHDRLLLRAKHKVIKLWSIMSAFIMYTVQCTVNNALSIFSALCYRTEMCTAGN